MAQVRVSIIFPYISMERESCLLELQGKLLQRSTWSQRLSLESSPGTVWTYWLSAEVPALSLFSPFLSSCKLFSPQHQAEENFAASLPLCE